METVDLRHVGMVELAEDGRRLTAAETRQRGLLVVGRQLLAERETARRAGRALRPLRVIEARAIEAALAERDAR